MKNIKNISIALATLLFIISSSSLAGTVNHLNPLTKEEPGSEPMKVNFLGEFDGYLYFQVAITAGNQKVSFAVSDKAEGELYSTDYRSDNIKTYKIEKREGQELDFNLKAGKKYFSTSYSENKKPLLKK